MARALVIVDVQNDFVEGGSLAVSGGKHVASAITEAVIQYRHGAYKNSSMFDYIVATKDFHLGDCDNGGHFGNPPDFVDSWPVHCVQGTEGAMFAVPMQQAMDDIDAIFYKGQGIPPYSGFQGTTPSWPDTHTLLDTWLKERQVDDLTICGLATDYCVKATAFDAIDLGYHVRVPWNLTAAVHGEQAKQDAITEIYARQKLLTRIN